MQSETRSNDEKHGGAAPRPDRRRWPSGEVAVKKELKWKAESRTAADVEHALQHGTCPRGHATNAENVHKKFLQNA